MNNEIIMVSQVLVR